MFQRRFSTPDLKPKIRSSPVPTTPLWGGFSLLGTRRIPAFSCRSPRWLPPTCAIHLWQGQPSSPSSEVRCFCCPTLLFSQRSLRLARLRSRLGPGASQKSRVQVIHILLGTALGLGVMDGCRRGGKGPSLPLPGWFPAPGWALEAALMSELNPARRHLQRLGPGLGAPCN